MSSEGASGAAMGGQLEEKVDLAGETDAKILQATTLAMSSSSQLPEALALLAAMEKKCRLGNDSASLVKVCEASVKLAKEYGADTQYESLIGVLETLSTRRSQKTAAVKALVLACLPWCVEEPYKPIAVANDDEKKRRDKLVNALLEITEGKIFLERERAQLTRAMAAIKEEEGDISGAADQLQDVHVETFGALSKRDKVEFILEQMRLTLAKQDFIRAHIVAGKVSKKHLAEENMEEYKVKFYELMTIYHRHKKDSFELAKDYHAIYSTPSIQASPEKWKPALEATICFLALSPYGNEQQDMMNHIAVGNMAHLEQVPAFQQTIQVFLKKEIIQYPMAAQKELEQIGPIIQQQQQQSSSKMDDDDSSASSSLADHWHSVFRRRIIQHNIRIVAGYYKQITVPRLATLLQLDPATTELEISSMVSDGSVYAKIDRPASLVRFLAPKSPEAILTDWAADIDHMLRLVETTSHLINKENMTAQ
eukprot:CAMPEP_0198139216 /NCGR_PEP_ID=MMETSP1443-20131203/2565_1 /TAXON_ID=186043 /ORGANISM="Entomoneis sp., Strain CCMP2396" /LENGTH=480 /DNA_ID=CAMNT_0043801289 /DNA_START=38 /DNA_END=1480 /DNA_ORIENTATION=-